MTSWQKIIACTIAAVLWLAAIIAKHFWPDIEIGGFVIACASVISAVGIHSATTSGSASAVPSMPPIPGGAQTGFMTLRLLAVIAAIAFGLALAGCTTITASAARGYEAQAKAGIQAADDNQIIFLRDAWCLQPYGAVVRHPEVQPAVASLCGQMANATSIDPTQAQRLLDIAKQLGVTAAPAAVPAPAAAASGAK